MKISLSGKNIYKFLCLTWIILCILIFIYYPGKASFLHWANLGEWQHLASKLGQIEPIDYVINFLQALVGVVIFSFACISLGALIISAFTIGTVQQPSTLLTGLALLGTAFLIGHGLFSLIFLTLGGVYQLTAKYVILLLLIGSLFGLYDVNKIFLTPFLNGDFKFSESRYSKRDYVTLWLSLIILFFSLLYSSARISYDSSAVYFSDAKLTAITNHVQYFTDAIFLTSTFQTAIQYTALILVFGDQSARMFSWICGSIIIIFSLALGERVGLSKHGKLILFVLLVTSTALLDLMGDGKVDLISSAPAIAAIYWMIVEDQTKTSSKFLLVLIGFLSGLAMVARPFNAFVLGIFVILFYLQRIYFKRGFEPISYKLVVRSMFWIGIGTLGLGIYHLFANWMILGNPFAFLSSFSNLIPSTGPWDYNPDQIMGIRLLYPFVATFYNSPQTLGNISPLFLAFLPALFLPEIRKNTNLSKPMWVLVIISIITLLLWIFLFFTVYEIRYVLFLWAIIFMPVAEIIAVVLENNDRLLRQIPSALIIALLVFIIVRTIYISLDTYSPIDKRGNPQCFCDSLSPINKSASTGDRVLTLNAYRYYLRSDLFACSTKHDEYKKLRAAAQNGHEAFWLEVYKQGYKFISYDHDYTTRHLQMEILPSPDNAPEWLELEPIYGKPGDSHVAYRINIKTPPVNIDTTCKLNASGIWEVKSTE